MSKLIITEQEKNQIRGLYNLVNESIFDTVINKLKNTSLYKKVESAYDPDPAVFVRNILPQFPKLEKIKDKLLGQITQITKMTPEQKQQYVQQHSNEVMNNAPQLNEQFLYGAFLLLVAVCLTYIVVGLSKENRLKKNDPEAYNNLKNPPPTINQKINQELQKYIGKTINLYDDKEETDLGTTAEITNLVIFRPTSMAGDVQSLDLTLKSKMKGVVVGNVYHRIYCQFNPEKLEDRITVNPRTQSNIGGSGYYLYNKKFTDTLNSIVGPDWCKRPKADFGKIQSKTDTSNMV